MCICQTCVFFKFVQFCKAFHDIYMMCMYVLVKLQTRVQYHQLMVCLLTHHNIVYLCVVPKDISCTMLSSWEKNKRKKVAFSQRKRVRHWSMAVAGIFKVNFFSGERNIHHKLQLLEP